ncbi:PEP-CTERM sorting domain-containing protein [bacterium]|nr:PEP-CTERM sorting domain-containing protein [bacterium]MDB4526794.1 PEP-CTERM sorting domain-containing protein [bacterium]
MKKCRIMIPTALLLGAVGANAASLVLTSRTQVSSNNANFDISVFDGNAKYNDRGLGGSEPGAPTSQTTLGDGTVLSYNFVGNEGTGSALTTYASGGSRTPTPTAPAANVHGNGEDWANVWTTNDPGAALDFSGSTKNHNPTGIAGAVNTFARAAEVDGSIDITGLASGDIYIPHGTFINQWTLTLTMSGPGQTDVVAFDTQDVNGPGTNLGWITNFTFTNEGQYDTISYNYTNADRDGSRARFMGVVLTPQAIPEPSSLALLGLAGLGLLRRRR